MMKHGYSNVDNQSYISYIKEKENIFENRQLYYKKISLDELKLTSKQLEIINIYSSLGSMQKTAEILNISKSTVQTIIERIRLKANKLIYDIEF